MIEVKHCSKIYPSRDEQPAVVALKNIDLVIQKQEFLCLLGPSGCGKTTLVKMIGGLVPWDEGEILINNQPVTGPGPDRSMVFQNFALLPWADVLTNVAFGLELRGVSKKEREEKAMELIRSVNLSGFEHHYPNHLSGGMQQRVGLARALAVDPQILLMDEPSLGLAPLVVQEIFSIIRKLNEEGVTILLVEQNARMALRVAHHVYLIEQGQVTFNGSPDEIQQDEVIRRAYLGSEVS